MRDSHKRTLALMNGLDVTFPAQATNNIILYQGNTN